MTLKLDSIIIFVQSVEHLKSFYVDIFGLEILEETQGQWLLLKAGTSNIGLHQIGQAYLDGNDADTKFETNTKIVFEIDGDIHTFRDDFISQNVTMKEVMTWENYPFLICDGEDPEGNIFQLKSKKV
jgi:catechol 2,3-dioxygenase-like lactoylglutathione lyase family enzyme